MSKILIYANQQDGILSSGAKEALSFGLKLAGVTEGEVAAVLVGTGADAAAKEVISYGASKAFTIANPLLSEYNAELYVNSLFAAFHQAGADVFILSFDRMGKDLAGRLATRIGASAITEVVDFKTEGAKLTWVRPIYGDKAFGEYSTTRPKVVVGLRPKSQEAALSKAPSLGEIIPVEFPISEEDIITKLVVKIQAALSDIRLEDARIIISGGRGIGGQEGFQELTALANVLGGTVGASRAACDAGWVQSNLQVGQTGAAVAPDLYIAVGISGASQHLAGITNAKTVVAINTDPDAPIFKRANLGVIADYKTVLPALTEKLKKVIV